MAEGEKKPISRTVGYAMPPNKVETVFRPSLVAYARERGICLVQVHLDLPLVEQGPFDCLVHKVYGDEWKAQLQDYTCRYPQVVIIDSPTSIERLHNRASMLEVVNHLAVQESDTKAYSFGIPKQVVINNATDDAKETMLTVEEQLNFPMIAKPLEVNGTDKSHELAVVFSSDGLKKAAPPVVLQEFVNHGGVLFKVYVAGDHVECVKRRSLPDFHASPSGAAAQSDTVLISQISSTAQDDSTSMKEAEMPCSSFIHDLAKGLREATRLHLFNFDVIRDARERNRYLVVDINYFPGYAKVPGFEAMLTDFFSDVIIRKHNQGGADADADADAAEVCLRKVGCGSETASLDRIVKKQGNCLTMIFNIITGRFFRLINGTMT